MAVIACPDMEALFEALEAQNEAQRVAYDRVPSEVKKALAPGGFAKAFSRQVVFTTSYEILDP